MLKSLRKAKKKRALRIFFATDVHGYMMSGGAVRPAAPSRPSPAAKPAAPAAGAATTAKS